MNDLFKLANELNADDYTVFIAFSGHVEWIDVSVHHNGWVDGYGPTNSFTLTTGEIDSFNDAYTKAIQWLEDDHAAFRVKQADDRAEVIANSKGRSLAIREQQLEGLVQKGGE